MDTGRTLYQPPPGASNLPWLKEITSFDADESESDYEAIIDNSNTQIYGIVGKFPGSVANESSNQQSVEDVQRQISYWIQNDMHIHTVTDLSYILTPLERSMDPVTYSELWDLHESIQELKLELLNIFDNYLCFSGAKDQTAFIKLSRLASAKAMNLFKNKNHTNSHVTENLLAQASDRLQLILTEENQAILQREKYFSKLVSDTIVEEFTEMAASYLQRGHQNSVEIHKKVIPYCLQILDKCLDYAGKLNSAHTVASTELENKLISAYEEMRKQYHLDNPPTDETLQQNPANIAEPSLSNTQKCLLEYKAILDAHTNIENHTILREFHKRAQNDVIAKIGSHEEIEIAKLVMDYYFAYVSESFEASSLLPKSKPEKSLCINIVSDAAQVGFKVEKFLQVGKPWQHDPDFGYVSSTYRINDKKSILEIVTYEPKLRFKVRKAFTSLNKTVSRIVGKIDYLFVVSPTWLDLHQRATLRSLCYQGRFDRVFILRESSLVAFSWLKGKDTTKSESSMVVGISVGFSGVIVEIFKSEDNQKVQLVAVASYKWDMSVGASRNPGFLCFCSESSFNPRAAMNNSKNPGDILQYTVSKAVSQLEENLQNAEKQCFFLGESEMWYNAYHEMIAKGEHSGLKDIGPIDPRIAMNIVLNDIQDPSNFHTRLVDHPIWYQTLASST